MSYSTKKNRYNNNVELSPFQENMYNEGKLCLHNFCIKNTMIHINYYSFFSYVGTSIYIFILNSKINTSIND